MPCAATTRCSRPRRASSGSGNFPNRCSRLPRRCDPTAPDHGDRTPFTSWSRRMRGACRSSAPGAIRIHWAADSEQRLPDYDPLIGRDVHPVTGLYLEGLVELGLIDQCADHAHERDGVRIGLQHLDCEVVAQLLSPGLREPYEESLIPAQT